MPTEKRSIGSGLLDTIMEMIYYEQNGKSLEDVIYTVLECEKRLPTDRVVQIKDKNRIEMALNYLLKRDFIYLNDSGSYCISVEGALFYDKAIFKYIGKRFSHRPFYYEMFRQNMGVVWRIVKIVTIFINGSTLLFLAIYSGCHINKKEHGNHILNSKQTKTSAMSNKTDTSKQPKFQ